MARNRLKKLKFHNKKPIKTLRKGINLMALDDLDLEFEDEEEAKKKKNDAVHQDVDLEFQMQGSDVKPRPSRPGLPSAGAPAQGPQAVAQVKKLDDARAASQAVRKPVGPAPVPPMAGSAAVKMQVQNQAVVEGQYDLESEEIVQLRERARKAEFDAEVKVQVAEFKTEILSELLSDAKLMDHQINQLLLRINAKHPDMKQEVLMIKKILADFTAKKRK
jgi:hypothetical protein